MPSSPNDISIILPAFNENENLRPLFDEISAAMNSQPRPWRIFFVDDASTDNTLEVIRALASEHDNIEYVSFAENRGQSAAVAAGFKKAKGEIFITMDSDLQDDPAGIPSMLTLFDAGNDMVIGFRGKREDTWSKRMASKIANSIRNKLSHETVKDTGCALRILRASMARELPMFTGMHRFLPTLMRMRGAKIAEMEVVHRQRRFGSSKYGVWDRAFSALYDLFAIRWMQKRHFMYNIKEECLQQDEPRQSV